MSDDVTDTRVEDDEQDVVRVTLLGQEYALKASLHEGYLREVAAFLDAKLNAIRQEEPSRPPLRIAMLVALNLTEEVLSLRREKLELLNLYEQKVQEFTDHLNRGLLE